MIDMAYTPGIAREEIQADKPLVGYTPGAMRGENSPVAGQQQATGYIAGIAREVAPEGAKQERPSKPQGFGESLRTGVVDNAKKFANYFLGQTEYDRDETMAEHPEIQRGRTRDAIAFNETSPGVVKGDRYAYNKHSGSNAMGLDMGKYQVTEGELKTYGEQFLGRKVTAKEFLASPELQDQYMDAKITFLTDEGLTPEEVMAFHRYGMTGWGDPEVRKRKVEKAKQYIKNGMAAVNNAMRDAP
jgi:hypothetical protein